MFKNWLKIKKLEAEIQILTTKIDSLATSVASIRGIINRKLFSGKFKEEEPAWLKSNLELIGIERDKNTDGQIM